MAVLFILLLVKVLQYKSWAPEAETIGTCLLFLRTGNFFQTGPASRGYFRAQDSCVNEHVEDRVCCQSSINGSH